MLDKNGMEIKTGMVVEIKDAFFKNDNGFTSWNTPPGILTGAAPIIAFARFQSVAKSARRSTTFVSGRSEFSSVTDSRPPKREPGIKNTRQSKSEPKSTVQKLPPTLTRWPKTSPIRSSAKPGTMAKKARL